ncbi:choline transporter-like protein 2 isoform X1 [Artemia franciscana]|uniref:choline transporter-like protein 2 isoform X1 n=1 Tax=Artemia franciscana TaxID=6661 RepID=UPI0032DAF7F2
MSGKVSPSGPRPMGPVKNRSCTDIICLLLFLFFLGGWGIVGYFAFTTGHPEQLIYPTDSNGNLCGRTQGYENKTKLFFFDLSRCASPTVVLTGCPTPQVCVEKCPAETFVPIPELLSSDAEAEIKKKLICHDGTDVEGSSLSDLIIGEKCAPYYVRMVSIGNRCVPSLPYNVNEKNELIADANNNKANVTYGDLMSGTQKLASILGAKDSDDPDATWLTTTILTAARVCKDLMESWWIILSAFVIVMITCLLWIFIMRFITGTMVWISVVVFLGLLVFSFYYSYMQYQMLKKIPESNLSPFAVQFTTNFSYYLELSGTWMFFMVVIAVVFVIFLLMMIFLRNRINLAVALIAHGSKAVAAIPMSLLFPIIPYMLQLAFAAYFVAVTVGISSSGGAYKILRDNSTTCCPVYYNNSICLPEVFRETCRSCPGVECKFFPGDNLIYGLHAYNLFGFFWSMCFATSLAELVLAGAFASWYWTFRKPKDVPLFPLWTSFYRAIRYHLGTLAFGSLLIAIIQFVRAMLEWLDRKLKKYHDNWISRCLICCCKCCLWMLEKFMRFINRNAYIITAIRGTNFFSSAREAVSLIMRNLARVWVLDKVTDLMLLIGRLVICIGIGILSNYVLTGGVPQLNSELPQLSYQIVPIVVIVIGSYFITGAFFGVYAMAVDTMFLSFLIDCENNDGSEDRPYYMSKDLMEILGKRNMKAV